jgi:hypothetical protein
VTRSKAELTRERRVPVARRPSARLKVAVAAALLAAALVLVLAPLVGAAFGAGGSGSWIHQFCSPAALDSAAHTVGRSGLARGIATALAVHWPHFLPLVVGLAAVRYLWRADARFKADRARTAALPGA